MQKKKIADTRYFPSGFLVNTGKDFYLIQNNSRLRVASDEVKKSWSFQYEIKTNEDNLRDYPILGNLGFRSGTVFYSLEDGLYYIIEKNLKRQIINSRWFKYLGINRLDVAVASASDARLHKTGEVLD